MLSFVSYVLVLNPSYCLESSDGAYAAKPVAIVPLKRNSISGKNLRPCSLNFATSGSSYKIKNKNYNIYLTWELRDKNQSHYNIFGKVDIPI